MGLSAGYEGYHAQGLFPAWRKKKGNRASMGLMEVGVCSRSVDGSVLKVRDPLNARDFSLWPRESARTTHVSLHHSLQILFLYASKSRSLLEEFAVHHKTITNR